VTAIPTAIPIPTAIAIAIDIPIPTSVVTVTVIVVRSHGGVGLAAPGLFLLHLLEQRVAPPPKLAVHQAFVAGGQHLKELQPFPSLQGTGNLAAGVVDQRQLSIAFDDLGRGCVPPQFQNVVGIHGGVAADRVPGCRSRRRR